MSVAAERYPRRAAHAARTRSAIVRAAGALFAERGYVGTTMKAIAERADVSVESVYLAGSKRALLGAALDVLFAGDEADRPLAERPEWAGVFARDDLAAVLDGYVALVSTSIAASARLWGAALAAADGDPEIAAMVRARLARRRADIAQVGPWLLARGLVAEDAVDEAVATLSVLVAHETYEHLVSQFGWSLERYRRWLRDALERNLLPPATASAGTDTAAETREQPRP